MPSGAFKLRLARYNQESDLVGVWFAGFPDAARDKETRALEYGTPANLRWAADKALRRVRVTVAAANTPKENLDWSGCSGGVVLFRQREILFVLGVIVQVPRPFKGALDAVPIVDGLADKQFHDLLSGACDLEDIQQLERLPGPYEVYGIDAYSASERVFSKALSVRSYGRDVTQFDKTVEGCESGAVIIRAEAGMGKSVFLARWAAYRAAFPKGLLPATVLRHAFSVGERASSTQKDMVASLVRQAALALGSDGGRRAY